jgi:hypothetical protein
MLVKLVVIMRVVLSIWFYKSCALHVNKFSKLTTIWNLDGGDTKHAIESNWVNRAIQKFGRN